jgi:LemA protein
MMWLIILAVIFVPVLWVVISYNSLVTMHLRAHEAISDIDVQLKRRFDLIPNLVETVKGYASHESETLQKVTEARAAVASSTGDPLERAGAENMLSGTLKTLFAVTESYPDLKANTNFLELQRELSDTENKIQASRRFYNTTVRDLNTAIETVPTNIIANIFKFEKEKFFEVEEAAQREVPKVSF